MKRRIEIPEELQLADVVHGTVIKLVSVEVACIVVAEQLSRWKVRTVQEIGNVHHVTAASGLVGGLVVSGVAVIVLVRDSSWKASLKDCFECFLSVAFSIQMGEMPVLCQYRASVSGLDSTLETGFDDLGGAAVSFSAAQSVILCHNPGSASFPFRLV